MRSLIATCNHEGIIKSIKMWKRAPKGGHAPNRVHSSITKLPGTYLLTEEGGTSKGRYVPASPNKWSVGKRDRSLDLRRHRLHLLFFFSFFFLFSLSPPPFPPAIVLLAFPLQAPLCISLCSLRVCRFLAQPTVTGSCCVEFGKVSG